MVTCLKINTVMGGFKLLESHNRSVSDLHFTIFALQIIFYIAACIPYSCIILILRGGGPIKRPSCDQLRNLS